MVLKARIARLPASLVAVLQLGQVHRPDDLVHPTTLAQRSKVVPDAWTALGAVAELEALSDLPFQPGVVLPALARRFTHTFGEAAVGDRQNPAHGADGPDTTIPRDEAVLHCGFLSCLPPEHIMSLDASGKLGKPCTVFGRNSQAWLKDWRGSWCASMATTTMALIRWVAILHDRPAF